MRRTRLTLEFATGASIIAHVVILAALYLAGPGIGGIATTASPDETQTFELIMLPETTVNQSLREHVPDSSMIGVRHEILHVTPSSAGTQSKLIFAASSFPTPDSRPAIAELPTAATESPTAFEEVVPAFAESKNEEAPTKLGVSPVTEVDPAPGKRSQDTAAPGGALFNEASSVALRGSPVGHGGQGFSAHAGYLMTPKPNYPKAARKRKMEGLVLVAVAVSTDGLPSEIEVEQGSGFDMLDQAAIAAVKGWRFTPARKGDKPVASRVQVPIVFKLATSRSEAPNPAVAWSGDP